MKKKDQVFPAILKSKGLKVTPPRLRLLSVLSHNGGPRTARELGAGAPELDQVTVYRTLETFVAKDIVRTVDIKHPSTHYELVATRKHHHHAICVHCGLIEDVTFCLPQGAMQRVLKTSKHFASLTGHSLEFMGVCKQCIR